MRWNRPEGGGFDQKIHAMFRKMIDKVVPIGVTIYMAYAISQVFVGLRPQCHRKWFVSSVCRSGR